MTPLQDEILTILAEECAEVIQEICKCKRFGLEGDNRDRLRREVAQLEYMISLFNNHVVIDPHEIEESYDFYMEKKEKLKVYSNEIKKVI